MIVGTWATRRRALRQFAAGEMSSTSGSKLANMLTAVRRTAMGWLWRGVSLSISTTWLGSRISATSSERKASRSSRDGSRPRHRRKTVSEKLIASAMSWMSYPWYNRRPCTPSTSEMLVSAATTPSNPRTGTCPFTAFISATFLAGHKASKM